MRAMVPDRLHRHTSESGRDFMTLVTPGQTIDRTRGSSAEVGVGCGGNDGLSLSVSANQPWMNSPKALVEELKIAIELGEEKVVVAELVAS